MTHHDPRGAQRRRVAALASAAALVLSPLVYLPTAHAAPAAARTTGQPASVGAIVPANTTDIQVLATNDFHGRLKANGAEAGAAVLAGAVKQLRTANPNTNFVAAGDLIGASTFESFIDSDKPTIDALNEAGLDVSAAGNHEFDQGYNDLVKRVMAPYDATTNPLGGAKWQYLAANLKMKATGADTAIPKTWTKDFGNIRVGYIGAVTEHLPELVSPDGIADIEVTNIVSATNTAADQLVAGGADIVILLVHEGAATTDIASATDPNSDFGKIVNGVNANVDAIVSGHTHLAYNHAIPVPAWAANPARTLKERPVVSAGQYGTNLNQLVFSVDTASEEIVNVQQKILPLAGPTYPVDPTTKGIVDAAVAKADVKGAVELGQIAGPFTRAKLASGAENRGGESTEGNLVAEAQRWATESARTGGAQIAFMNPGGLRADMTGSGTFPSAVTYKQAATTQPFANTLVNIKMTGAQIKQVLEQQWQPAGASRPFLKLGASAGFSYTYDPAKAAGSRVSAMFLNGAPIDLAATYSVTANSFLASGGDNFTAFNQGQQRRDTGQSDLAAMVDYLAAKAKTAPLPVAYDQRAVGVSFPAGAPATYQPGDQVAFKLTSLAFSNPADTKDTSVKVSLGSVVLGEFPVDNTVAAETFDEIGKAAVAVTIPAGTPPGAATLTVVGQQTGTRFVVPVQVAAKPVASPSVAPTSVPTSAAPTPSTAPAAPTTPATPAAPASPSAGAGAATVKQSVRIMVKFNKSRLVKGGKAGSVTITVSGASLPTGTIRLAHPDRKGLIGTLKNGKITFRLAKFHRAGLHEFRAIYLGDTLHAESVQLVETKVLTKRAAAKAKR